MNIIKRFNLIHWNEPVTLRSLWGFGLSFYLLFVIYGWVHDVYFRAEVRAVVKEAIEIRDDLSISDSEKEDLLRKTIEKAQFYNKAISGGKRYAEAGIKDLDLDYLEK